MGLFAVLFFLVPVALPLIVWKLMSSRVLRAEAQQRELAKEVYDAREMIASLLRRVTLLEQTQPRLEAVPVPAPAPLPVTQPKPAPPPRLESKPAAPIVVKVEPPPPPPPPKPKVISATPMPEPAVALEPMFARPVLPPLPKKSGQEWEALVGGNWLNKLGVFVLVIGIALLLGYEFTRVGPIGRVGIGMTVGFTLLLGGMFWEKKEGFAIFARGLMGGGWATLYFTAFAMHAVPAAKVIENPYLATVLLLSCAVGMIVHSLRFTSQTVTGLAYFIAFATLGISQSTLFSVIALLPLAASLLFLAYRFDWYKMAVFGILATYMTCASRADTGSPLSSTQALFASYWLLFEAFDLLRLRRRIEAVSAESFILPLNAVGFFALSLVKWHHAAPAHIYQFLAVAAAAYLVVTYLHTRLRFPASFSEGSDTLTRMAGGGYEAPITVTMLLTAAAVLVGATGNWIAGGLLAEGEVLFLAGWYFKETYLRQLAGFTFLGFAVRWLQMIDPTRPPQPGVALWGHAWRSFTPMTALAAGVFWFNRSLKVAEGIAYSSIAAGFVALVLAYEVQPQFVSVAWLIFAVFLFELGFLKPRLEFRLQSYVLGILGTGTGLLLNGLIDESNWQRQWLPLLISSLIHYAIALQIERFGSASLNSEERNIVPLFSAASSLAFLATITWKVVPYDYLGAAWMLLGIVVFELGLRNLTRQFRYLAYVLLAIGVLDVVWCHVYNIHKGVYPAQSVSLGLALAVSCAICARLTQPILDFDESERRGCRDLFGAAATLFACALSWRQLPAPAVAVVWSAIGISLLEAGVRFSLPRFRVFSHIVSAAAIYALFVYNFTESARWLHVSVRLVTFLAVIASEYYTWWRYQPAAVGESERNLIRIYLYVPAALSLLLAGLEVHPPYVFAVWAFLGLAFYQIGQWRQNSDLAWQGCAAAFISYLACAVNFYTQGARASLRPEIITASLAVAMFYYQQLVSPRQGSGILKSYAHIFYSLLASTLLAFLLFREVSGGMLTVALSVEALALLVAGFPLRDRFQRLSGLFLFFICVLKLFFYDFRALETVNRILSFIVLGLLLVAVSWVYTRFRERIKEYL